MRGKHIVWLAFAAMLLTVTMTGIATGAKKPKLRVSPVEIHNEDMSITAFAIDIIVDGVEDLYCVGFTLDYAPYVQTLSAAQAIEGPFLQEEGIETDFVYKIDHFHGEVKVGSARLGQVPGVSGSGTVATIEFAVVGYGDSRLSLTRVELYNSDGQLIDVSVPAAGNYYGMAAEVEFAGIALDPGRSVNLATADVLELNTTVVNTGAIPMKVTVRYDLIGEVEAHQFYAGQIFRSVAPAPEYLYVDGYYPYIEGGWTGTPDALIGPIDYNVASSTGACSITSMYTFEDISLGTRLVDNVDIQGYTKQSHTANDFDPYIFAGDVLAWTWADSMGGTLDWEWTGGRYYGGHPDYDMPEYYDITGYLHTEEGINNIEILLHNYGASGPLMQIDAMRVKVEFAKVVPVATPVYTVEPGETASFIGTWALIGDDVGKYYGRATVEYSVDGVSWVQAAKVKDFPVSIFDTSA